MSDRDDDSSESPPDIQEDQGDGDNQEHPTKRPKRSRACQACRSMKIRCLPVEGQEACKACSKVNRACIMPGPARKRQKTVHKVAELEKKIDALTATLAAKQNAAAAAAAAATVTAPTPPTDSPTTTSTLSTSRIPAPPPRLEREVTWESIVERHMPGPSRPPKKNPSELGHDDDDDDNDDKYQDVITRGILDEATAIRLYVHWKTKMFPYCPIVAFSDSTDLAWLRKNRPMTLLAIFVVAGVLSIQDVQPDLAVELARQIADRVMYYNEKSLDLIHAMIVSTTWGGKHKFAKDLGFNQFLSSAVVMCLDMGLGKRSRHQTFTDAEDAEIRRTWMALYFLTGSVASVLRLPPTMRYSSYLQECLDKLPNHHGALPSDNFLCCLVQLRNLIQDVNSCFHMDDPGETIRLDDSRTKHQLKLFERQLEEWKTATRPYMLDSLMTQYEAVANLYIHEIALHNEHNIDDFRPMYRTNNIDVLDVSKDFLTNAHFESLTICIESMERAMSAFLSIDDEILVGLPVIHIVWTAYVAVALIRLEGVLALPDSKYGSIFLPKLNVGQFLDRVITKLGNVAQGGMHVPAGSFSIAFRKLKMWHMHKVMRRQQLATGTVPNNIPDRSQSESKSQLNSACTGGNMVSFEDRDRKGSNATTATLSGQLSPQSQQIHQQQQQRSPQQQQQQQQYQQAHSPLHQQQQQQQQFNQMNQSYPQPGPVPPFLGIGSAFFDPTVTFDASAFDVQNWDFNVSDLNNFETNLNDTGWMGYLL